MQKCTKKKLYQTSRGGEGTVHVVLNLQTQLLIGNLTGGYKKYRISHKTLMGSSLLRNRLKEGWIY